MVQQVEDDFIDSIYREFGLLYGFLIYMNNIPNPAEVSFIKMASYEGTSSK
jgi:hypothetical protein